MDSRIPLLSACNLCFLPDDVNHFNVSSFISLLALRPGFARNTNTIQSKSFLLNNLNVREKVLRRLILFVSLIEFSELKIVSLT